MIPKEGRKLVHEILTLQRGLLHNGVCLGKAFSGTADEDFTLADITDCDFPGYAGIGDPAWDPPIINGSGQAEGKSSLLTWTASGGLVTPQTIVIVYIRLAFTVSPEKLLWFKKLSPTVTLAAPGEQYQTYVDLFADDIAALD